MKKILKAGVIIFLVIVSLPIFLVLLFKFLEYQSSLSYVDVSPPKISALTNKDLISALLRGHEDFFGTITVKPLPFDTADSNQKEEITYTIIYTGDDSLGPSEYKMIAEFKHNKWTIIKSKMHWQCLRDLPFSSFWHTSGACI